MLIVVMASDVPSKLGSLLASQEQAEHVVILSVKHSFGDRPLGKGRYGAIATLMRRELGIGK